MNKKETKKKMDEVAGILNALYPPEKMKRNQAKIDAFKASKAWPTILGTLSAGEMILDVALYSIGDAIKLDPGLSLRFENGDLRLAACMDISKKVKPKKKVVAK